MVSRRTVALILAAVAGAAILALAFRPAGDSRALAAVGEPAPLFEAQDLAGRKVALSQYRGREVIINFWASWCTPCRDEFPLLKRAASKPGGPQVLGVIFDDSPNAARRFMVSQGAEWPALIDADGRVAAAYGVSKKPGIPVSVFVDRSGRVTKLHIGVLKSSDLGL